MSISSEKKLTLAAAILININIMMGVGIFINTIELSKRTGILSAFLYPLMGLLILPLIMSIAQLMKLHPTGGFYGYGRAEISPLAGFIATWSYFTGKLASAMLMIHTSVRLLMHIIPLLQTYNNYVLDVIVLGIFIALNMLNIRTGSFIQMGFLGLKLIPVISVIILGCAFFDVQVISTAPFIWEGIPASLPFVLYAAMGFEASVSLSSRIEDAAHNGPKAIYYSFITVMVVIFLFQFFFYNLLGSHMAQITDHLGAFPLLASLAIGSSSFVPYFVIIMHVAIAFSALGGSYGIVYSNSWNLYTLAQQGHVIAASYFTKLNRWGIPVFCILAEGFLCLMFLAITAGVPTPLVQVSALSSAIAYTISVIALLIAHKHLALSTKKIVPMLGMVSCSILLFACIRNFFLSGLAPLGLFLGLGVIGISMYLVSRPKMANSF